MFDDFFSEAQRLSREGVPFATATVVRAERPTSGKPGDKAIITLDGVMYGWIGGSCAQPTVIREALRALADDRSRLVRLSPNPEAEEAPEGVEVCKMTCYSGGTLDVYIEPQAPKPHLRIAGHLPTARALAHLGRTLGYRVTAIVPPGEQPSMEHAHEVSTRLKDLAEPASPLTFVVIATHGHNDEEALEYALESGAPYIGLVASPKRAEAVRGYLKIRGLKDKDLSALKAPAGLDLGSRRGDEIALSILAEIVQLRRTFEQLEWTPPEGEHVSTDGRPTVAIDPVCQMEVVVQGAQHTVELDGQTFYFCCGGCAAKFKAVPEQYLSPAESP